MRACILTALLCLGLLTVLPVQAQGYRSYDLPGPEVGEGIEKEEEDFAAEVAKAAQG